MLTSSKIVSQRPSGPILAADRLGMPLSLPLDRVRAIRRAEGLSRETGRESEGLVGYLGREQAPVVVPEIAWLGAEGVKLPSGAMEGTVIVAESSYGLLGILVDHVTPTGEQRSWQAMSMPPIVEPYGRKIFPEALIAGETLRLRLDFDLLHPEAPLRPRLASSSHVPFAVPSAATSAGDDPGRVFLAGTREPELRMALSLRQVVEVLRTATVLPVPGCATCLIGLIAWREQPVPVIDVVRLFVPESEAPRREGRYVLAQSPGGSLVALLTSHDLESQTVPFVVPPMPLVERSRGSLGSFETPQGRLELLDLDAILSRPPR